MSDLRWRSDYDAALVKWLRALADAVESQEIQVQSFGKPVLAATKRAPDLYQFQPDIRFFTSEVANRLFASFPPGPDA